MVGSTAVISIILYGFVTSALGYECDKSATICETSLVIDHGLTMMHETESKVYAYAGKVYKYNVPDPAQATPVPTDEVMTADGWENGRLIVVANKSLPGPQLIVYEGQIMKIHIINNMASDTLTIHWHGLPQHESPWMDGVPFVTQCPILSGQTFTYEFIAKPKGTYWYHSHVGSQRSKGMNGALVIRERISVMEEHIMTVQGWSHTWGSDTDHQKAIYGHFVNRVAQPTSNSVDGGHFSRFFLDSVLINGRGRYYTNLTAGEHNGAPLSEFSVDAGQTYRFRVINVGALYPIRVSVDNHELAVIASDGFDVQPVAAESFIINPGERYDFTITTDQSVSNYWVRAESLEINMHRAEAILRYTGAPDQEPTTSRRACISSNRCLVVNCPFITYPSDTYTDCLPLDHLRNAVDNDHAPVPDSLDTFKEHHLNFGFPGTTRWPATINGKEFKFPEVSALTQPFEMDSTCDQADCGEEKQCYCTHTLSVNHNDVVQLVLTNMGSGTGWSHPVHLHGYTFYVVKMGYATYNTTTAKFISQNTDIDCRGAGDQSQSFCNDATWRNSSWLNNNVPGLELDHPPRKDTLIIPSGGYAIIRIKVDNPGVWIMHCHIELHASDGMVLLMNDSYGMHLPPPKGFPICHGYPSPYRERYEDDLNATPAPNIETVTKIVKEMKDDGYGMKTFWIMFAVLIVIILLMLAYIVHVRTEVKTLRNERESSYIPQTVSGSTQGKENPTFTKY